MIANGYKVSFWDDENVLNLDCGDGCIIVDKLKVIDLYILFLFIYYYFIMSLGLWDVNSLTRD